MANRQSIFYSILLAALVVVFGAATHSAWAQEAPPEEGEGMKLTPKILLGNSVDKVGPEESDMVLAIEAFAKGNSKESLDLLKKAKQKTAAIPPPELLLAKLHMFANQPLPMRQVLEEAVALYPEDPEPYLLFADQAFVGGRTTDAQLLFAKAKELVDKTAETGARKKDFLVRVNAGLAAVAERRANWDIAIGYLENWSKIDPKSGNSHFRLGQSHFMKEAFKEAYADFTKAKELDPNQPSPDIAMGLLYEQKANREQAKKFMDRAIAQAPKDMATRLAVIRWLIETQQYSDAKTQLEDSLKIDPQSLPASIFSGVVARLSGDRAKAIEHFQNARLQAPTNFEAANQLAALLSEQSDVAQQQSAIQYAEANYKLFPQNPEAAATLAWVYYQTGKTALAQQAINQAIRSGNLSADAQYFIAKMLYDRAKTEEAKALLTAALSSKQIFMHRNDAQDLLKKIP